MAELKLGYKASAEQFAPRELVELAVAAEEHGMDSATVSDHFQPWRHEGGHAPFSLAWMTAVGERTKRLILGHLGADADLPLQPRRHRAGVRHAWAACTRTGSSSGSGTGEALNEIATGYEGDWPEFKERFARLRESVKLMRELWLGRPGGLRRRVLPHQGRVDLRRSRGRHPGLHRRGRARWWPSTRAAPATASSAPSARARSSTRTSSSPRSQRAPRRQAATPDDIDRMIEIKISYDPDPKLALENTRFWAPLSLTAEQKHTIDDPIEMEKAADALPIEQVAKRWIVASDPDEAVEKVGQYVTWGLNHLVFHAPGHDQRRFLELFAEGFGAAAAPTRLIRLHGRGRTAIYVASPEGDTGKSTIALGILHRLAATVAKVGVFRPITRLRARTGDYILSCLLAHTTAGLPYEECVGVELSAAARRSRRRDRRHRRPVPRRGRPVRRGGDRRQRLHRRRHPERAGHQRADRGQPRRAGRAGGQGEGPHAGGGRPGRRTVSCRDRRPARPHRGRGRQSL